MNIFTSLLLFDYITDEKLVDKFQIPFSLYVCL